MNNKKTIELIGQKNKLNLLFPKWARIISLSLLGVSILIGAGVAFYHEFLVGESKRIAEAQAQENQRIAQMKSVEEGAMTVRQKTRAVSTLMNQRPDFSGNVKFSNSLAEKIVMDRIIVKDAGKLELTGKVANALIFSQFLSDLQQSRGVEFDRSILLSTSRLTTSDYAFAIQLVKDAKTKK